MLSLTWTFAQAVFANHFGDNLVERFPRLRQLLRPGSLHKSGAAILIRTTTRNGTVVEIRTSDVATARVILREQLSRSSSAPN